jgi:predicted TIM-barrel fold metal-dependent hydrolase
MPLRPKTTPSSSDSISTSTDAAGELLHAWADQPAIDHHCHPLRRWPFQLSAVELRGAFTEALDSQLAERHAINTVAYQDAIRRIAGELQCQATEAAILGYHNAADPAAYARRLMAQTATGVMLVDNGFATAESFTLPEQEQAIGIKQRQIIRLETVAEGLIQNASDPRQWFDAVRAALRAGVGSGAVGVKTICAYRASLKLQPVDTDVLGVAFSATRLRAQRGEHPRLSGSALCHALLFEAAQECRELDVPLQVHCGFGDPDEDLAETSPLGLRPFFIDPAYRGLRVALLHCYPYHREAAYLCSVFPDVYMDLSLTIPFAGLEGGRAMREALGLCPTSKLLYASDASRYPEVFLVAAAAHREALADALGELVDRRIMDTATAANAGRQVLADNARRVYRLDERGK